MADGDIKKEIPFSATYDEYNCENMLDDGNEYDITSVIDGNVVPFDRKSNIVDIKKMLQQEKEFNKGIDESRSRGQRYNNGATSEKGPVLAQELEAGKSDYKQEGKPQPNSTPSGPVFNPTPSSPK
jgi:hypothetical protein